MARKPQLKRTDQQNLATPTQDNNKFVYAALFTVSTSGEINPVQANAPFLLNPDGMEDNKDGNWVENNIPGQSDPILQWVSGGARNLSFTALVTKDTVHFPPASTDLLSGLVDSAVNAVGAIASAFAGVNVPPLGDVLGTLLGGAESVGEELSIANQLDYYRSLMYPSIDEDEVLVSSPPLVMLAVGKTLSSLQSRTTTEKISAETDLWATKAVNIRITKWLPNMTPMEAEVSFQFVQYVTKSRGNPPDIVITGSETLPAFELGGLLA